MLSAEEARVWALRGGLVQILVHAAPAVNDDDEVARYKRERRFIARSGELAIRVQVMLVARFEGACPNLLPDMRCGIYNERPTVCRIYPAEIIPGMALNVGNRLCPPEAWSNSQPPFLLEDGYVTDDVTRGAITKSRATALTDVPTLQLLVQSLGIDVVALENEGFAVWTIASDRLIEALDAASSHTTGSLEETSPYTWRFLSLRPDTATLISSVGADVIGASPHEDLTYIPLY
ncbi:hypothetical protein QFZ54_003992 [Sphingomonas faeni]|nr:hypothetical protein [Sphingomonas faeni]